MYTLEPGYDKVRSERFLRIKFKISVTIDFDFKKGKRHIAINKDDSLLVWRGVQQNGLDILKQFDANGFYPFHMSQTGDHEYMLAIMKIKRD